MWLRWLLLTASLATLLQASWAQNVSYRCKSSTLKSAPFLLKLGPLYYWYLNLIFRMFSEIMRKHQTTYWP